MQEVAQPRALGSESGEKDFCVGERAVVCADGHQGTWMYIYTHIFLKSVHRKAQVQLKPMAMEMPIGNARRKMLLFIKYMINI